MMQTFNKSIVAVCMILVVSGACAQEDAWNVPDSKENFHVFLLMGQSNMAGGVKMENSDSEPLPYALMLSDEGEAIRWAPAKHPLHFKRPKPNHYGLGIAFARSYLESNPGVTIGLVPVAWGGRPMDKLNKGSEIYDEAIRKVDFACKQGTIKGVLWAQGESDTVREQSALAYSDKLQQLVVDVRTDLVFPDLPFVVADLPDFYGTGPEHDAPQRVKQIELVRSALRSLPSQVKNTGFVETTGCKSCDWHMVHYDRESYDLLGKRFAKVLAELVRKAN